MSRQFNRPLIPILPRAQNRRALPVVEKPLAGEDAAKTPAASKATPAPVAPKQSQAVPKAAQSTKAAAPASSVPPAQAPKVSTPATVPAVADKATVLPTSLPASTVVSASVPVLTNTPLLPSSLPSIVPQSTKTVVSTHRLSSTSALASASKSSASAPSSNGAVSAGSIIGGIGGAILGLAIISFVITFFVRRSRKKRSRDVEGFDSTSFRRSAVLLEENGPPAPDYFSRGNGGGLPRPPTLIANRLQMASTTASNAATYPNHSNYTMGGQQYYPSQPSYGYSQGAPTTYEPMLQSANGQERTVNASSYMDVTRNSPFTTQDVSKPKRPLSTCTTVYNEEDAYGGI